MTHEILTNEQMREADRVTIDSGIPGTQLMETAGQGVFDCLQAHFPKGPVLVLCGPGNNGGDGFVVARLLLEAGREVQLACLVPTENLKGDAAWAAREWSGETQPFSEAEVTADTVIVDAVFGTGFDRALEEPVVSVFQKIKDLGCAVVAVDIPSGVNGNTAVADPHALQAAHTVTFHRKKLGHVLQSGTAWCGQVHIHDIGIKEFESGAMENHPDLWRENLPHLQEDDHKYKRGAAVLLGGAEMTGAIRLASQAVMRVGAGLCVIAAPKRTGEIYRQGNAHIIVEDLEDIISFPAHCEDARRTAILMGPGAGQKDAEHLREVILATLALQKPTVLDADALNVFEGRGEELFAALHGACVLTPHEGEFRKLFGDLEGDKLSQTQQAAEKARCVVLHKGADTVIAAKGQDPVVNTHASPVLATAGSGDVLAGLITGFLAQKMDAFDAACVAAWIHGEAGIRFGTGLVAEDIPELIPQILKDIL